MNSFVAFRYPGKSPQFLQSESTGNATFVINPFVGDASYIKGNLLPYTNQLENLHTLAKTLQQPTLQENFVTQAGQLKKSFENSELEKCVLSRIKQYPLAESCNLHDIFTKACQMYSNELVYVLYTEEYGIWVGATPEVLLEYADGLLKTMALAGTKSINDNSSWKNKEIEEHGYVETYIEDIINDFSVSFTKKQGQEKLSGSVKHLLTTYEINLPASEVDSFLKQLHPTSAVAGIPKLESIEKIQEVEQHERLLYTGFIGLRTEKSMTYYVNLRCMQLGDKYANIFVGGGHTIDSIAADEWEETEMKSLSMIKILENC